MSNLTVYKSNELVEAGYRLSLAEQRLIVLSLGQLDSRDIAKKKVTLHVKDYAREWGVSEDNAHREIKQACNRLFDRYITLKNSDETTKFRWIQSTTKYHKGDARVSFTFSDDILPFLFELNFALGVTKYEILNVSGFSSVYSFRLYELAIKLQGMRNKTIQLDELRRILQLETKYPEYKEFNKFVLKPALRDINEKSDIFLELSPIKQGRRIVALDFSTTKNKAKTKQKRQAFPHKNKYGRFVKLDRQNPKMSSHEYGLWAKDCLLILEDFYSKVEDITNEDLLYYWVFLAITDSNKSKLGHKNLFADELKKRGYKIVECELVKFNDY